ncbi:MAG: hypothetical protein ACRCSG_00570 [Cellulosilyticaceae bacterium]
MDKENYDYVCDRCNKMTNTVIVNNCTKRTFCLDCSKEEYKAEKKDKNEN